MPPARRAGMATILAITYQVRTVLGDARPVRRWYGDGSADCPYCGAALSAERGEIRDGACHNPWCDANPNNSPERLAAERERRATLAQERTAEAELGRWRTEYAAERAGEHQAWLDAT